MTRNPETPDDDAPEQMAEVADFQKYRNKRNAKQMRELALLATRAGSKARHPASQNRHSSPDRNDEPPKPSPLKP
ncbi:hypothetical protein A2707_03520 [Candidatus Saccharibacteria bacterium RIFCSPHIGHO2_01_FULL_45_15]|nr:MAG: hypothetical protein A2707_03520 [Candidatus Saccharibacteria bacterium RIFCSPHIGHO2_01_FULL_45_15]OGL32434.1 MAG: hypothetical protein A3E76_00045 [Candidatus Saccharibacteria bacterium RIFCSPHIGHO2_12_FULL_44_22]